MTDIAYDPEFPFVVKWGAYAAARFSNRQNAVSYAEESAGKVFDTTPPPKIPADAQYITWGSAATAYSRRGDSWVGGLTGRAMSQDEMLNYIGNADVIVLKAVSDGA